MLYWALNFLILAVVAGVLGFGGIAGTSAEIARVLFFFFLIGMIVTFFMNIFRGRGVPH